MEICNILTINQLEKSGRADSNRRRPAWEAGILPLNYARKCLLSKHLRPRPSPRRGQLRKTLSKPPPDSPAAEWGGSLLHLTILACRQTAVKALESLRAATFQESPAHRGCSGRVRSSILAMIWRLITFRLPWVSTVLIHFSAASALARVAGLLLARSTAVMSVPT